MSSLKLLLSRLDIVYFKIILRISFSEQKYNFRWDGNDEYEPIEVSWYKYFPRGNSVNRSTVLEEVQVMLREIISYLIKNKP